jgi:hypothetical protein
MLATGCVAYFLYRNVTFLFVFGFYMFSLDVSVVDLPLSRQCYYLVLCIVILINTSLEVLTLFPSSHTSIYTVHSHPLVIILVHSRRNYTIRRNYTSCQNFSRKSS